MSNAVYPKALDALAVGDIDYLGDTIRLQLLDETVTYNDAIEFLDDIASGAYVGTAEELTGKSVTDGECFSADVTVPAVATGSNIKALIVFVDTGTPATSHLLTWIDTRADTVPIDLDTNGADIVVSWPSGRVFKI